MRFATPEFLHLLWVLPILGIWWLWRLRRVEQDLARWCGETLWSRMVPDRRVWAPYVKGSLVLLATAFLAVAAARPQVGSRVVEMKRSGIDVVVALDLSESMLAEDLAPNRITRAKQEIGSLIERLRGDRIGLVAFAGDAFVQCPLTLDYAAARMFLRYMDTGLVPIPGTAIARAVDVSVSAHEGEGDGFQAVVLITDGEDHEGEVRAAAERAAKAGVRVFAVGIGTAQGEPIPIRDARGGLRDYKRDRNGEVVLTTCNSATLEDLCRTTGGKYFDGSSGGLALDRLYAEIESMEERELEGGWATEFEDRYGYFVAVALFLLMVEWWMSGRRRLGRVRRRLLQSAILVGPCLAPATALLGSLALPGLFGVGAAWADPGTSAYGTGDFEAARDYYERFAIENPADARVDYNLGTTLHQTRELDPSESALQRALRAEDPGLRARAFYNLGNTQVRKGDLEAARESFRMSLLQDPRDRDAKINFEIVDRLLQESPPDSSQQQQDQQNENEDEQQDQEDQQDQQDQDQQQNQDDQQNQQDQQQDQQDQGEQQDEEPSEEDEREGDPESDREDSSRPEEEPGDEEGEQPPPQADGTEEELPISPEEARRLLEALGQQEMQLQAERMKAAAKTRKVEKDW